MDKEKIGVALCGLGGRGMYHLNMTLSSMPYVNIAALCEVYADRLESGADTVRKARGTETNCTQDFDELLAHKDDWGIDCIIIASSWITHIDMCIKSMKAGIPVGSEVGGAHTVEACWDLVRTYEQTRTPVMLLENCCYGKEELTVLNMVRKGVFGETVHAEGGYQHDLRDEVALGHVNRHYRLEEYMHRNGEIYPTHELGPIAKWLDINRGNRMLTLTSMASKARGVNDWILRNRGDAFENASFPFTQGDVVNTLIKCARGETIALTHDTTLPRPYSRGGRLQGTHAIWCEDKHGVHVEGRTVDTGWSHSWEDISDYYEEYLPELWKNYIKQGVVPGHDGIDYLVFSAFFESIRRSLPMPIDVYDMAAWMVITPLSEQSIALGSTPVPIPDFTSGQWMYRKNERVNEYSL